MFNYDSFSIRPIEINDKDRILQWRNSERVRCNMYNDHVISQQEHEIWFEHVEKDASVCNLIFSHEGEAIGFASFTGISTVNGRCYWAFYLGEGDAPRGAGSVMEFFALDYAFTTLEIRKLCCEVFAFNGSVIKLHEKFGFIQEGRFLKHYLKNGKYEDIVCLAKFGENWIVEREIYKKRLFGKRHG
ncbi:UDP-4-amino-4,6-dideoxy-N-acetyl-beta-L-altrosamine N-acetyltransferase [Mariprofundus sp. NF]|uniref:UDP-4-amino-4, 6-dideoxy-N-acetyl-beta-L-altrosamine N-acetyltransferase n=1 Tax=Mariprofundus sp. NF TaxID=2608716 RepID=UPI0015A16FED|nr:UDP-4-amino-4,6-dideoxy-N-acetyl-beta-L-altrosamine N-acetyltransferase [Mariprofundus sp. NF]NWF37925.1 UDP-4-amino-4,6-dideoxy-N-acetyl-beta-L-altrosamine N-acetyltransferase [Mariprofundus sp. NF]